MHTGRTIYSLDEFQQFIAQLKPGLPIAADVETFKTRPNQQGARLLGLALSGESFTGEVISAYFIINHYNKLKQQFEYNPLCSFPPVTDWLLEQKLVGWNVPFDKSWIDDYCEINSQWIADGRILWHLQNNDPSIRGFGLKLAQKRILGWEAANDTALEENVKKYGGSLKNGDHYLADLDILSHYACLDTYSTLMAYKKLCYWMDKHDYWGFSDEILQYSLRLHESANQGLPVDVAELMRAASLYSSKRDAALNKIVEVCNVEIKAIEDKWRVQKASTYKRETNRYSYLSSPQKWRKFNPSSGLQRETLIHTMLEFPINERTPTGRAKTDRANLSTVAHPGARSLVDYSEYKKVAEQAKTYLKAVEEDGSLYTNYDVCGTVSGRLSGFSPSVLNMPFSEPEVMGAFKVIPGYIGIHADLAAIEPCVLAHYSEDPALLKVYKDGKGDIYLDLALEIFPENEELKKEYDPNAQVTSEIKEKFKDVRAVCKIIHLAVSYTGTMVTVARNLSKSGYPTSRGQAMLLVKRYWTKFSRVKAFDIKLQSLYSNKGFLRNLVGRIIQVPDIYKKDLMNRVVQSSAHDVLRLWVMVIIRQFDARGVVWRHWLPDLHDSTTFMIREQDSEIAKQCYFDALQEVEKMVHLSVPLKCELKFNKTLAGIKGRE